MIFVREVSDPLTSLVKAIDQKISAASGKYPKKLGTFVIIGDAEGRVDQLHGLAQSEGIQRVNLCIGNPPPRYEINPEADITVVIYTPGRPTKNVVTANFALRRGELDESQSIAIVAALTNVLPK